MCVIVAKYFKETGWVLAKNRDQDYVSTVTFKDKRSARVGEVFTLYDNTIQYQEGCNYKGLVILTTSLAPSYAAETNKEDGDKIAIALGTYTDPEEAADYLIKKKLTGFIFCSTPEKLVLVEAGKKDDWKGEYQFKKTIVPKTQTVVRTNHGIDLPWAGFQYGQSENQDLWRKSSELRMQQAEKICSKAKNLVQLIDGLASDMHKDKQLNLFRIENKPRQMRTIFQWGFDLKDKKVYIRPIQTKMDLDTTKEMIDVEVLDNQEVKNRFNGKVRHFTKIKIDHTNGIVKSVQTEQMLRFGEFIK
jgi:hypothetical protein